MTGHEINAEQARKNYEEYIEGLSYVDGYSILIQGNLARPSALDALDAMESKQGLRERAEFVKSLLKGCTVAVSLYGEEVCSFSVTEGFQWFAVSAFQNNPQALKYVLTTVYGVFLKNCVPHLTESQEAARKQKQEALQQL